MYCRPLRIVVFAAVISERKYQKYDLRFFASLFRILDFGFSPLFLMAKKTTRSFTSTLERFGNTNLWHSFVTVPASIAEQFIEGNSRRVVCTLNQTETFHAALMHSGKGDYFINVNAAIRKKLKLREGDDVLVNLEKDTSEYGLPVPEEFKELLAQDPEGNRLFHAHTLGKQRTLLYIIAKPKDPALRIRNGIAVLEHLKRNNGAVNYKQLNTDIRNTF